jgi:uncharacterized small protein (DUF1192 family)
VNGETVLLGYSELAERLGLSRNAARMKAKRATIAGRWRMVPRNHPSDRIIIEVPAEDLNVPHHQGKGDRPEEVLGGTEGATDTETGGNPFPPYVFGLLQSAHDSLNQMQGQLADEMIAHRQTAMALAEAQTRLAGLQEAIEQLEAREKAMQAVLTLEKEAHHKTEIDLAQTATREMGMMGENEYLEHAIRILQSRIRKARRPWWWRLRGRQ